MSENNAISCTQNIHAFDIAKLLMSIGVVAIHTMGKFGLYPFLRIAVPMFFCISSYLFFRGLDGISDEKKLQKFLKRNVKLYSFWFSALLVPTLVMGGWLQGNIVRNLIKFILRIIVGSTFPASWYIPALMISVIVIFYSRKRLPDWLIIGGTFVVYAFCCIASNYRGLLGDQGILYSLIIIYPGTVYNSFPVGLLWVAIGAYLTGRKQISMKRVLIGEFFSLFLLIGEYFAIQQIGCMVDNDCYFSLIPVCFFLMELLLQCNVSVKLDLTRKMRNISTIIYCLHGTVANILKALYLTSNNTTIINYCWYFFLSTLFISIIFAVIMLALEEKSNWKWLRFSH